MIATILLEHVFVRDEKNKVWSDGVVDYNYLKRYLNVFDKIIVCARIKDVKENNEKNYNLLVSGNNVEFVALPYALNSKEILKEYFSFRKIFEEAVIKSDKVIIRGPSLISLMLYGIVLGKKKVAVEFVMGAEQILTEKNKIRKYVNQYLNYRAKKMCLSANGVSYVTKYKLQEKYPSYSIKFGADSEHFDSYYSSIDLLENDFHEKDWKNYMKPERYTIIHVGSMQNNRKGQKRLIDISEKLIQDGYFIDVIFIGNGKLIDDFKKYAEEKNLKNRVTFTGNISDRKVVFEYLKKADLFVLPSSSEGLPRSIIEAMACSLPCVASNVDGIPELLDSQFLVDYNDIEGYVKIIENLLENFELMKDLGKNNFEKAKEYSIEELSKRRIEFYNKLKQL